VVDLVWSPGRVFLAVVSGKMLGLMFQKQNRCRLTRHRRLSALYFQYKRGSRKVCCSRSICVQWDCYGSFYIRMECCCGQQLKLVGRDVDMNTYCYLALFIFNTKEAAEKFVAQDPYVSNGIVTGHSIFEWSVVVGSN
jgi:hypothetical protein